MYYLLILVILICYYLSHSRRNSFEIEKVENKCTLFICAVLVILAAFRSDNVGADTLGYRFNYETLSCYPSFQALVERYTIYYIVYYGLSKLFSLAGMPVQVWFGFVEAFYLYALVKLINKFSKDKVFSLLIFTTIGLFTFSLAGLKQTMASAIMMLAFVAFVDKKYILTVLLACVTYFTHQAALILLGAFPIYLLRNNRLLIPTVLCFCLLIYLYSYSFMETMVSVIGNEKWEDYLVNDSKYSSVTFIFYAAITFVSLLNFKGYNEAHPADSRCFFGLSALGCALQLLAGVSPSLFRLALLYTPFFMILIPNTIYYSKSKLGTYYKYFIIASVIFYFLYTGRNSQYSFI